MSLNSKQKSLCQLTTTELYSKETKKGITAENDKTTFKSDDAIVVFSLTNHADPYFLAWWSLTAQEKFFF